MAGGPKTRASDHFSFFVFHSPPHPELALPMANENCQIKNEK
jgi:hypothetical protein